jgi:hypothetical protein
METLLGKLVAYWRPTGGPLEADCVASQRENENISLIIRANEDICWRLIYFSAFIHRRTARQIQKTQQLDEKWVTFNVA